MADYLQVTTSTDSESAAEKIAQHVVDKRVAACVQIVGPVKSVYRWQGKIETAAEWLCQIKTRADRFDQLESAIREVHTYDVPEIIAVHITHGGADYLSWLDQQVSP